MSTGIDYVDETENFITGCTKVSPGCKNCYAETQTVSLWKRFKQEKYRHGFNKVVEHRDLLSSISFVKKPTRYMINSMSDTFHPDVSFNFLYKLFEKFIFYPWNTFVIVTKRAERASMVMDNIWLHLSRNHPSLDFPLKNVWLIVTTENQEMFNQRIPFLLKTPVAIRGLSIEPMLGPMDIRRAFNSGCPLCCGSGEWPVAIKCTKCGGSGKWHKIDWVIVGGESGSKGRPMHPDWPASIQKQCQDAGIAYFFKQWGEWGHYVVPNPKKCRIVCNNGESHSYLKIGDIELDESLNPFVMCKIGKKKSGNILNGKTYSELPVER